VFCLNIGVAAAVEFVTVLPVMLLAPSRSLPLLIPLTLPVVVNVCALPLPRLLPLAPLADDAVDEITDAVVLDVLDAVSRSTN